MNTLFHSFSGYSAVTRAGLLAVLCCALGLPAGVRLVRDLFDPAMAGAGIPQRARELHDVLTPRVAAWADARVRAASGAETELYDVPTTEWPMFTAVFYLMATENLEIDWAQRAVGTAPHIQAADAIRAARALILDPANHSWVMRHWGPDYLHDENVFFRGLLIAGLASHENLTHDGTSLAMLRDQVETLSSDLLNADLAVLNDYPRECYPIDVLATLGFIERADRVLGTNHQALFDHFRTNLEGPLADRFGLPMYRFNLEARRVVQPSRGIGTSWSLLFVPDLYGPEFATTLYDRYTTSFYQDHGWAAGFREYARDGGEGEWTAEVDAGPVVDGFGTTASAFGIAAARRNGRFDHAYALAAEMSAASLTAPDGSMVVPRAVSHAAAAPYLGETALLYFLTVQPHPSMPQQGAHSGLPWSGRLPHLTGLVWFGLAVFLGLPLLALIHFGRALRAFLRDRSSAPQRTRELVGQSRSVT